MIGTSIWRAVVLQKAIQMVQSILLLVLGGGKALFHCIVVADWWWRRRRGRGRHGCDFWLPRKAGNGVTKPLLQRSNVGLLVWAGSGFEVVAIRLGLLGWAGWGFEVVVVDASRLC